MKYLHILILTLAIVGVSCSSDDDSNGPAEISEQVAFNTSLAVDIPESVLSPTATVDGMLEVDMNEIDNINGEWTSVTIDEILFEIDNYEGGDNIEFENGTLTILDGDNQEIVEYTFTSSPLLIKDYDDSNVRFPADVSNDEIADSIEESFMETGKVNIRLQVEVEDTPVKFDFITYVKLTITGPQ